MAKKLSVPDEEIPKLLLRPKKPIEPEVESEVEHISINKVSKKIGPSEGNTTLPVEHGSIISIAILDSGAGISVATKSIWEKWGKPTVRSTRMNLQLADGKLENPIGILENVSLTSCGIEYTHSFAVVDFGQEANYELILGRTLMRQFSMVQDWGYDYIYLRHKCAITRVNLKNHAGELEESLLQGCFTHAHGGVQFKIIQVFHRRSRTCK